MKRRILAIMVAAVMLMTIALSGGSALAQGQSSCFGAFARAQPGEPGPGEGVSQLASSGAALVADKFVPIVQRERPCPLTGPFVP
jgi:hypothetical protein